MSYHGKNPRTNSNILTDQGVAAVTNPASGSSKVIVRNNDLYLRDPGGVEKLVGDSAVTGKDYILNPDAAVSETTDTTTSGTITLARTTTAAELPEESKGTGFKITVGAINDYVEWDINNGLIDEADGVNGRVIAYFKPIAGYADDDYSLVVYDKTNTVEIANYPLKDNVGFTSRQALLVAEANCVVRIVANVATSAGGVFSGIALQALPAVESAFVGPWIDRTAYANSNLLPTGLGSGSGSYGSYLIAQHGELMLCKFRFDKDGTNGTGAATVTFALPDSLNANSALTAAGEVTAMGTCINFDIQTASAFNTNGFSLAGANTFFPADDTLGSGIPGSKYRANSQLRCEFAVPIEEWKGKGTSNLITEQVAKSNSLFDGMGASGQTITQNVANFLTWDTINIAAGPGISYDGTSNSTAFTALKDIDLDISGFITPAATTAKLIQIYKNGSANRTILNESTAEQNVPFSGKIRLAKDDTFNVGIDPNTTTTISAGTSGNWISIQESNKTSAGDTFGFGTSSRDIYGITRTESGKWTPVVNAGSNVNITTITPSEGQWLCVEDVVTASVKIDIDPAAVGGWVAELSLPINPDATFTNNAQCVGPGTRDASGTTESCYVRGGTTASTFRFRISGVAADAASRSCYFQFTYQLR